MSACELEVGRPRYQVVMFQAMAPSTPAKTTNNRRSGLTFSRCTRSPPTVFATRVPKIKNAIRLKNAAHITARRGESTRVETTVAMELAASWNPLV